MSEVEQCGTVHPNPTVSVDRSELQQLRTALMRARQMLDSIVSEAAEVEDAFYRLESLIEEIEERLDGDDH